MLLQELTLSNIRSYSEQKISFPEGTTLLSGDIGSGKSTILLAVEFALFGTSRPDLPAELLLRKGTTSAFVELKFALNKQTICIKRSLKKEKRGITQQPGHIIINDVKKDLMPVELKAEIVNLLGYPEEFITKNKNYIFRYTMYTPQEEMKMILQEKAEDRLDVLRKIFNIDKYKVVRENIQIYLKTMRGKIATFKTRLEPFEDERVELQKILAEKEELVKQVNVLKPSVEQMQKQVSVKKQELELTEKQQQQFIEFTHQVEKSRSVLGEKETQLQSLVAKNEELVEKLSGMKIDEIYKEELVEKISIEEKAQREFIVKKTMCEQRIKQLQQNISEVQEEMKQMVESQVELETKKKLMQELQTKVNEKNRLTERQTQLKDLFEKTTGLVSKNETILGQSKELHAKIGNLETCPTCLQDVGMEHKQEIRGQEEHKITHAESLLLESKKKQLEISIEQEEVRKKLEEIRENETLVMKTTLKIEQLEKKQGDGERRKEQLKVYVQENNALMLEMEGMKKIDVDVLESLKKQLEVYTKREFIAHEQQELVIQLVERKKNIMILQETIRELEQKMASRPDNSVRIMDLKKEISNILIEEKELSVRYAQLNTQLENQTRREEEKEQLIVKLTSLHTELITFRERYNWLDKHFLKLTYTIEKHVMQNIHLLFNELFKDWFGILIEDENVYARIDDSFTPVIEQNGYEVGFENLSGGEKTSASLAYRLALNRVINDVIHRINTKDVLILDEPTDGFSTEQLDKVRDVLDKLNLRQTIIVSHETKIESFVENVIRVQKEGHVSSVM
jgi:DNA repair protein SbcC/Rad50